MQRGCHQPSLILSSDKGDGVQGETHAHKGNASHCGMKEGTLKASAWRGRNPSTQGPGTLRHRQGSICRLLLHGQCQLQRLLLPALDDFFPELALVLHTLELGLDVLLRNLQESEHAVVSLLGNHVEDVSPC